MQIGTHVRLRDRHTFRDGQPDLSEAIGVVDARHDDADGRELVSVSFHDKGVFAPDAPVEFFEIAWLS